MNTLDTQYKNLLKDILQNGITKSDRTGTGTISIFGRTLRHKMNTGFPLLTTKKMYWHGIVTELIWFLNGDTNIKFLIDNNCNIWNGDAYKFYEKLYKTEEWQHNKLSETEFINAIKENRNNLIINGVKEYKLGDLGPVYGNQWRSLKYYASNKFNAIDQIKNLISELKNNPDSRRLLLNSWNVSELPKMALPPCHYGFQLYTKLLSDEERISLAGGTAQTKYPALIKQQLEHCNKLNIPTRSISLSWQQRSVDVFLGLPFNIASYGLLLNIIAQKVNMVADELIANLGDTHLYLNHIAAAKEQLKAKSFYLPTLEINTENIKSSENLKNLKIEDFNIVDYQSSKQIKAKLNN